MSINCIFQIPKKTFTRIPGIKFLGNRNKLLLDHMHHNDKIKSDVSHHNINIESSTPIAKPVVESTLKIKGGLRSTLFISEFNNIKTDFDIKRQPLSDEEIKIINFQEIIINDWSRIKLN